MLLLGSALVFAGYKGMVLYARTFTNNPNATLTADILLAMLSGPGIVPAVLCIIAILGGAWFVGIALLIILGFAYSLI